MEGQLAVPFHFAVEFLVLVVAMGAALDAVRARRQGAGLWALGQAMGFVALGGAQAAHGALVADADGNAAVLLTRAAGFALLALSARPAAAMSVAVPAAGAVMFPAIFFPGPDADLAVVPAVAALAVAARGVASHRKDLDPTTFAFAAAFVAFAAAEGATAIGPASGGTWLVGAHAARALAAVFLARWLWISIVRSVRMRFVAAFVVALAVLVLVVSSALTLVIGDTLEDEELKRLTESAQARVTGISNLGDSSIAAADVLANTASLRASLARKSANRLQEQALGLFRILPPGVDIIMFVDRDGKVLASAETFRSDGGASVRPLLKAQEIALAGSQVITDVLKRQPPSASPIAVTSVGRDGNVQTELVTVGASAGEGVVVGAVAIGYRIDATFLAEVRQDTGAEVTLVVGDGVVGSTLARPDAVQHALVPLTRDLRLAREDGRPAGALLSVADRQYQSAFVPVKRDDGIVVGMLALSRTSESLAGAQRDITRTLFLITLAAMVVAALLAWLSGGRVTRPIRSLTAAARELSLGNLQARANVASTDEVGTLGSAFNEMAGQLERKTQDLRTAAHDEATLRVRIEAIVHSMGDGLIATDEHGSIVTFNRAAELIIGVRADAAVGRSVGQVLAGTAANGRPLAEAAMATSATEGTLRRAGGAGLPVALTAAPLLDAAGTPVGRVVLVRDVSREHEAERMKSEFLSNVSHELRTPITPIKGYAEMLTRKKFPREKVASFLEGILESTSRLERIVDILVDFAAIEAGRLKPRAESLPVSELLDDLMARWRSRDDRHRFVRKVGKDLPPVLGDPRLLQRSLDELMDNAVKFSPGGGRIELIAEPAANGGRARRTSRVRITVRDHGIGIEPERLPDLFQDFRQLDGSETRSFGGLGLGLAYVKRIATAHGGQVIVDSKPGRGSSFSLVLPAAEATGETTMRPRRRRIPVKRKGAR